MADRPRRDILVVEDDTSIRETLRELLDEEGYDVLFAGNGIEALERLRTCTPRLILLDLMMPVMDGWQLRKELQRDPDLARIPVVVVSAEHRLDRVVASLAVQGWLAKPFDLQALLTTLRRFCPPRRPRADVPNACAV